MVIKHFDQTELARRWRISPRTLERWRWLNQGPPFLKLGGRIAYRIEDIEAYEAAQLHTAGTGVAVDAAAQPQAAAQ